MEAADLSSQLPWECDMLIDDNEGFLESNLGPGAVLLPDPPPPEQQIPCTTPPFGDLAVNIASMSDQNLQEVYRIIQQSNPSSPPPEKSDQWTFDLNELDETTLMDLHRFVSTHLGKLDPQIVESVQSSQAKPLWSSDERQMEEYQWQEFDDMPALDPLPFFEQPSELDVENQDIPLPQKRKEYAHDSGSDRQDDEYQPCKKMRNFSQECTPIAGESFPVSEPADSMNDEKCEEIGPSHLFQQPLLPVAVKEEKKKIKITIQIYRVEKTQAGPKPYICDGVDCEKAFADSSNLLKHIRTHTMEKPYTCPFEGCHKTFAYSSTLKEHINKHYGAKPFVCTFEGCGKSFAQNSNLRRHLRLHTGEKPYICDVCSKQFAQSSNLKQHLKTHGKPK